MLLEIERLNVEIKHDETHNMKSKAKNEKKINSNL